MRRRVLKSLLGKKDWARSAEAPKKEDYSKVEKVEKKEALDYAYKAC